MNAHGVAGFALDDMTQDEIAELLGLSRKTIGKRLDRIRDTVARLSASPSSPSLPSSTPGAS